MFNKSLSFHQFKKAGESLAYFSVFLVENKNNLNVIINKNNFKKLSFHYFILFEYILDNHVRKFVTEKEIQYENFHLFSKNFKPKTHQDILFIKDNDSITIDFVVEVISDIWNLLIKKDDKVSLVIYIEKQRGELQNLHENFKNLKRLPQTTVNKEFEYLLEKINENFLFLIDILYIRSSLISGFSQKNFYYSESQKYLLFLLFYFDQ